MITPIIERSLLKGTAKYFTFMMAYTGVAKIVVPDGKLILITSVKINPFCDIKGEVFSDDVIACDISNQIIVDFHSRGDRDTIIHRNIFDIRYQPTSTNFLYVKNSEPLHFNVFMIHENDVYVTLLKNVGMIGSAVAYTPLTNTQCPLAPVSYGKTLPVVTEVTDPTFLDYIPTSPEDTGLIPGNMSNQPVTFAVSPDTNLSDNDGTNNNVPLINIAYIMINESEIRDLLK